MVATKACPVVFRDASNLELLVFRHPSAGIQLVKGSIDPGETAAQAALRELREEAGISDAIVNHDLGFWDAGFEGQIWSFHLCTIQLALPDRWTYECPDDGGISLKFFWHDIKLESSGAWHPLFAGALQYIRLQMRGLSLLKLY